MQECLGWVWRQSCWLVSVNTASGSGGGQRKTHPPTHRWTGNEVPSSSPVQDDLVGGGEGSRGGSVGQLRECGGAGWGGGVLMREERHDGRKHCQLLFAGREGGQERIHERTSRQERVGVGEGMGDGGQC